MKDAGGVLAASLDLKTVLSEDPTQFEVVLFWPRCFSSFFSLFGGGRFPCVLVNTTLVFEDTEVPGEGSLVILC